jgi:hypothetical protein
MDKSAIMIANFLVFSGGGVGVLAGWEVCGSLISILFESLLLQKYPLFEGLQQKKDKDIKKV